MKPESLLKLAKLAYKSNEEAKSAEAHARACKVYAKQVRNSFSCNERKCKKHHDVGREWPFLDMHG